MRHFIHFHIACMIALVVSLPASAAPKFTKGTAVAGVIAFQDDADPAQFFWIPGRVDLALGTNLTSFKTQYWGIGPVHWAQDSTGAIYSIVGAILSGSANLDIVDSQRSALVAEIKKAYGVANPKLLPLSLKNVKVVPILDAQTLSLGKNDVTLSFPSTYQFGTNLQYSIGTGNSLFAQVVGARDATDNTITANPTFGVSIVGDAEFVGDPWTAEVKCDLSQVWEQTRTKVSASVSLGWFRIGSADYANTVQDLQKSGACKFDMKEGSLDNEKYGRQIFDMVKKVYEEVNKKATDGDGFFKFEPNPQAGDPAGGGASSWWPWSVSVNGGYSHAYFKQAISYSDTVSYTGRFPYTMAASMVLAVNCNNATSSHFVDLGDASQPCITQKKIDTFNARLKCEAAAKRPKLLALEERLALGEITQAQYDRLLALYNRLSFCESIDRQNGELTTVMKSLKSFGVQRISNDRLVQFELQAQK
jgi:hypothetical protein